MLILRKYINHCCRSIKCTNVLDLGPSLGYRQSSAWITTRAINSHRTTQDSRLGLGVHSGSLEFLQTELRLCPIPKNLKPGLRLGPSFYLTTNTTRSRPNICHNITLPSLPTRDISECPQAYKRDTCKLPPCSETSFDYGKNTTLNYLHFPTVSNTIEKHAARLIVIRKRKMKKHKLQKLRKKMKFEWAKVRQRREMRKEKSFQAELLAQIKEAEKFDAAQYVAEKLRKAHEVPIPRTWKGKRLPEFIIKEKLGIK